ncbi:Six-hairpin glycosidase [Glarea lozoyensis ATCC 20868]|uniref:Six-hairpin glycosidase n=1 Tax=Glarea lozoyensis (strain ATCC 20868 / MF5171) TaxID=1116229 RepID=S3DS80_GLAL2|nr:Six-hairpin glycosidase [Glarea lozoyensis ATCC 20868]EPE34801.1 Six-hairpin glycosidase [Glarea lozoyensis ATCC 20868]
MPRRYAFRYVKCEILDTSPKYKVRFSNFKVTAISAVSPEVAASVASLNTRHQDLMDIDRVSRLTVRSCMQTVFEDGPRRDRRLWMGDLRLQALGNYCTFKDFNSGKQCLYMFAALPREGRGKLTSLCFERPNLAAASDYIVHYDALFGATVYDYTLASGEHETAKELWSTILGSMKVALSHVDEKSRFSSDKTAAWKFLDWSEGLDTNAGMHELELFCCKQINALATILHYPKPHADVAKEMTDAVHYFYDEEQELFVSGSNRQVSWTSQAWMALSASMPPSSALLAMKKAMSHPGAVKPLTPYAYHHVAEALARNDGKEECLVLLRQYWKVWH